jgi:hypothetical protein
MAEEKGDFKIAKMLSRIIGHYKLKRWVSDMDKYFCSSVIKKSFLKFRKLSDKLRGRKREPMYITLIPQQPDDQSRLELVKSRLSDDGFEHEYIDIGSVFFKTDDSGTISK